MRIVALSLLGILIGVLVAYAMSERAFGGAVDEVARLRIERKAD